MVINGLILGGLGSDSRAGSSNSLESIGEKGNTGSCPHLVSVQQEGGKKPLPFACPRFLFCHGVFLQVVFGAALWLALALSLWESQLLAAVNPCRCSQCRCFFKPWQSGVLQHLAALRIDSLRH